MCGGGRGWKGCGGGKGGMRGNEGRGVVEVGCWEGGRCEV